MTHLNQNIQSAGENEGGGAAVASTAPVSPNGNAVRYGVALPLAATVTVALTLSMAALITTEFTPQDKSATASFEINPRVDDITEPLRTEKPDPLKEVKTPPPPPKVATDDTARIDLPVIKVAGKVTPFSMDKLDIGQNFKLVPMDKNPTPLVRIPPVFPTRFLQGDVSGYCRVKFDISAEGQPFNVETTACTNGQLRSPTVKSVQRWKYAPEMRDGRTVSRTGLETTIRFDLRDERGDVLPVPSGF